MCIKENTIKSTEKYLKELGITIIESTSREKENLFTLVGYTIVKEGDKVPEVSACITKEAGIGVQKVLSSKAKENKTNYSLLIIDDKEKSKYWYDSKTMLPIKEPKFESEFPYLIKKEDIETKILSLLNDISTAIRPFTTMELILDTLLIRTYLKDKGELNKWNNIKPSDLIKLLKETKEHYNLNFNEYEIKEDYLFKIINELKNLPPKSDIYPKVFISVLERANTKDIGMYTTTRNLIDIIKKIIKSINITKGKILDLSSGLAFILMEIKKESIGEKYLGLEINKEISQLSKIVTIISGHNDIDIENTDTLLYDEGEKYDLTFIEPPMGPTTLQDKYKDYDITKNGKRKRIDYSELFIEKAIRLTKEQGHIISIVPEGILSSSKSQITRDLIQNKTFIKGIISLPPHVLRPYSGTKLSVLILQKKRDNLDTPKNFFAGKIENLDDEKKVIDEFEKWINGGDNIG
ncbi:hypothetical protein [Dethiothermospora halolimnae]|uniref:hypothetical protein n=1 Tax=Dethiothermospora halolimnae TaxID=3114390 RepID=UPI003CCC19CA